MSFASTSQMVEKAYESDIELYDVIIEEDMSERGVSYNDTYSHMEKLWEAMEASVVNYDGERKSNSGLSGGDGLLFQEYIRSGKNMSGGINSLAICRAVSVAESNACMKRIVAAPTAGSCGVIPAVLTAYNDIYTPEKDKIIKALFIAAGVGEVIAARASISGAECGCQAEIGSASAMAACALTFLQGGDNECIMNAGAMALKNLLGLTCDPVGGYVEVPCVKRNAIGAVNAITATDMALAGITSVIPFDEVIDAMGEIGAKMDKSLRETAKGGLAVTPTAQKLAPQK